MSIKREIVELKDKDGNKIKVLPESLSFNEMTAVIAKMNVIYNPERHKRYDKHQDRH